MIYLFEENQKFTQWWVWVLLLWVSCSLAISINNRISLLIALLIPILFYLLELRVKVNKKGLYYRFFPIHYKSYCIKTNEIERIEALKYRPLGDYGGWGIRYGFKGKCYNVKGNLGVKVFLKNGSYILFGSQKHEELEKCLKSII